MLSAFKNFFITLLIAAAIFGVIAYFATQFVTATVSDIMEGENEQLEGILTQEGQDRETDASGETDTAGIPDDGLPEDGTEVQGNSFTFVVVTTGYRPELFGDYVPTVSELQEQVHSFQTASDSFGILSKDYREKCATAIVLVRVDKENSQVTYTYITPETRVYTSTGYHTLGEVYAFYGYERIGDYVTSLTGIGVDYTFLLDGYNFNDFLALFGTVEVDNPKNIYAEGQYHTTRSDFTVIKKGSNGEDIPSRYENSMVLSAGIVDFNEYSSHILNTMKERSSPDIETKGQYTIDVLQAYMENITQMDKEEFRAIMEKAVVLSDDENAHKNYNSDGTVTEEPVSAILTTNFTMEDVETVYGVLHASASYAASTIAYPGNYITGTDTTEPYFDPDIDAAIKRFLPYRFIVSHGTDTAAEEE